MPDALREAERHNYSLFMARTLFGYFKTPDSLEAAAKEMEQEVNECWQTTTAPFFNSREGAYADEITIKLEEVFQLG